jgi:hypothetical protein
MSKKRIASIPIVLASTESKIKIGKISDEFKSDKCQIMKDPSSKSYKLSEKKGKGESRFTGTLLADQSSRYLIMKYNPETNKIEAFPSDDWYDFKKDIFYQTLSLEEAEEKLKSKSVFNDYLKNKNTPAGGKSSGKKDKNEDKEEKTKTTKLPSKKMEEDLDGEEEPKQPFKEKKVYDETEEKEDYDPDLREVPSDIEEGFTGKDKSKDIYSKQIPDSSEEESSDDSFFGKGGPASQPSEDEEEKDLSDIDREEEENYRKMKQNENSFLGQKRAGEELQMSSEKVKKQKVAAAGTTQQGMEEKLLHLLAKNKQMTYNSIVKELTKLEVPSNEIQNKLQMMLIRVANKFTQNNETFYYKKTG